MAISRPPRTRFLRAAIFVGVAVLMASCFMFSFKSRSGEGLSREDAPFSDLPDDATDISYFIPGLMGRDVYLDFNTSEEGFNQWVEGQQGPELEKAAEGAFQIERFNFTTRKGQTIGVNDGLLYSWTDEPKGVFIGFDRQSNRAYFHSRAR